MSVFIFTGPTLCADDARLHLDAVYLPPVAQGDVYRVTLKEPRAIGIIDGYFDRVPSVWHKEILWALSRGIPVFGSASMGAMRAAELAPFGMIGVGRIFEAYRDGVIDADDEVALAHGPSEFGYKALSDPLVNIRQTLLCAEQAGAIGPATGAGLVRIALSLFYPKRVFSHLLEVGIQEGLSVAELAALRDWLPAHKVNQKRDDAIEMLRIMGAHLSAAGEVVTASFVFERTALWDEFTRTAGNVDVHDNWRADTLPVDALLEEVRLNPEAWERHSAAARMRLLLVEEARRHDVCVDEGSLVNTVLAFREHLGLIEPEQLEQWIKDNQLNRTSFVRLLERETLRRWTETLLETETVASLPDELRLSDEFRKLYRRALDKQRVLADYGLEAPGLADAGIQDDDLWRWYFNGSTGRKMPDNMAVFARRLGFVDMAAFLQAVLREYLYIGRVDGEVTSKVGAGARRS